MSGRAPRREVRRQWRWPELGARGERRYSTGANKMEEGKRSGAHRDRAGRVSELGGAPEWTNSMENGAEAEAWG